MFLKVIDVGWVRLCGHPLAASAVSVGAAGSWLMSAAPWGACLYFSRIGGGGCYSPSKSQSQWSKNQGKFRCAHLFSSSHAIWGLVDQMDFFSFSYSSSEISPEASRLLRMERESLLSILFFRCGITLLMKTAAREITTIMNIRCVMPRPHPITLPISQPYISVSYKWRCAVSCCLFLLMVAAFIQRHLQLYRQMACQVL